MTQSKTKQPEDMKTREFKNNSNVTESSNIKNKTNTREWVEGWVFKYDIHGNEAELLTEEIVKAIDTTRTDTLREVEEMLREVSDRMKHFYLQTDGSMSFPNSKEGDLLKMIHKKLTTLLNQV